MFEHMIWASTQEGKDEYPSCVPISEERERKREAFFDRWCIKFLGITFDEYKRKRNSLRQQNWIDKGGIG
nr:hypothetical protein Clen_193 [Cedratvirus lena]WIL04732.1 hypothetical protein Cduv_252 [Cedratvirus duvanny]